MEGGKCDYCGKSVDGSTLYWKGTPDRKVVEAWYCNAYCGLQAYERDNRDQICQRN